MSIELEFAKHLKLFRKFNDATTDEDEAKCLEIFRLGVLYRNKHSQGTAPDCPPGYFLFSEQEIMTWQERIETNLQVAHDAQIESYTAKLDKAYSILAELTLTATGSVPAYGAEVDAESLLELHRLFTLGRHFDILLNAKANHPMLENLWDQFTMALRLCGEDKNKDQK